MEGCQHQTQRIRSKINRHGLLLTSMLGLAMFCSWFAMNAAGYGFTLLSHSWSHNRGPPVLGDPVHNQPPALVGQASARPNLAISSTPMLACALAFGFAAHAVSRQTRLQGGHRRRGIVQRRANEDEAEAEELDVATLMKTHKAGIAEIRAALPDLPADMDDFFLMRLCLQHSGDKAEAVKNAKEVAAWRQGPGAPLVASAKDAIAKATAEGGWNNEPVMAAAPHSDKVSKYITPKQMLVLSSSSGDLITCIRASTIDSEKLMQEVTEDEMVEFFLYAREVSFQVAQARSQKTGTLVKLVTANDLTGVSSFPDKAFQNALTGSSKKAVDLWPGLAGPTVLLNLPWLARMLVGILSPLFPTAVRQKLKFARGPMYYLKELTDVLKKPTRDTFLDDLEAVLKAV